MESVGQATWAHSLRALKPGGRIVVCGATSGAAPPADLNRVFFLQLSVVGSTMGTRSELESLMAMQVTTGIRPVIDTAMPLDRAADGFAKIVAGDTAGKIVLTV
jgi:D-arabinose 1-dehydrogenase-like Zn-dependent alcohol dehydrogenase